MRTLKKFLKGFVASPLSFAIVLAFNFLVLGAISAENTMQNIAFFVGSTVILIMTIKIMFTKPGELGSTKKSTKSLAGSVGYALSSTIQVTSIFIVTFYLVVNMVTASIGSFFEVKGTLDFIKATDTIHFFVVATWGVLGMYIVAQYRSNRRKSAYIEQA